MMIKVKEIPETISVNVNSKQLVLPWAKTWAENKFALEALETLEDIKNVPTCGIIIESVEFGRCIISDPRGFSCEVSNISQLLPYININCGVIQDDLIYGVGPSSGTILLTQEMCENIFKPLTSVKELKPGFVYRLNQGIESPAVYLGRLGWKDFYANPIPYHTFAYPEKGTVSPIFSISGRDIVPLGYDVPEVYEQALEAFNQSWKGNKNLYITSISLLPNLRLASDFSHSDEIIYLVNKTIYLVKQKDDKNIGITEFVPSHDKYKYNRWSMQASVRKNGSLKFTESYVTFSVSIIDEVENLLKEGYKRVVDDEYCRCSVRQLILCNMSDGTTLDSDQMLNKSIGCSIKF